MPISVLSAITIATSDTKVLTYEEAGKHGGTIAHSSKHPNHPELPILTSTATYDTAGQARTAMEQTIAGIKEHSPAQVWNE